MLFFFSPPLLWHFHTIKDKWYTSVLKMYINNLYNKYNVYNDINITNLKYVGCCDLRIKHWWSILDIVKYGICLKYLFWLCFSFWKECTWNTMKKLLRRECMSLEAVALTLYQLIWEYCTPETSWKVTFLTWLYAEKDTQIMLFIWFPKTNACGKLSSICLFVCLYQLTNFNQIW